jgi:hypothetical protein
MARGQDASACDRGSKQSRPVIRWVIKIYYLELLRASEGTLSRWSRLHLHSLGSHGGLWPVVLICNP